MIEVVTAMSIGYPPIKSAPQPGLLKVMEIDTPGRVREFESQWLPRLTSPRAKMLAT